MESTSKYWIPVFNVLENDCTIIPAHSKYVEAIRDKKTDRRAIIAIARMLLTALYHMMKNGENYNPRLY